MQQTCLYVTNFQYSINLNLETDALGIFANDVCCITARTILRFNGVIRHGYNFNYESHSLIFACSI